MNWTTEFPTEPGYYAWKGKHDKNPYFILAHVEIQNDEIVINLTPETDIFKYCPISEIVRRLWLKID